MYIVVRHYTGASALINAMVQRQQEVRDLISSVTGFQAAYLRRPNGQRRWRGYRHGLQRQGGKEKVDSAGGRVGAGQPVRGDHRAARGQRGRDLHQLLTLAETRPASAGRARYEATAPVTSRGSRTVNVDPWP